MIKGVCTLASNGGPIPTPDHLRTYLPEGGTVRDVLGWHRVEKTRGQYAIPDFASNLYANVSAAGCQNVVTLAFGNKLYGGKDMTIPRTPEQIAAFACYTAYVVQNVPNLLAVSIENEENGSFDNGSPTERIARYAALLQGAVPAIRKANPAVKIIAGATVGWNVDGWYQNLDKQFSLKQFDYLDIHPYLGAPKLSTWILKMAAIRKHGIANPAWYTEVGGSDAGKLGAAYWPLFDQIVAADPVPVAGSNYFLLQATQKFPGCGLMDQAGKETAIGKAMRSAQASI